MNPVFEIKKKRNLLGQRRWHINLLGYNGESLTDTEVFNSKAAVEKNIAAVRLAAANASERWIE